MHFKNRAGAITIGGPPIAWSMVIGYCVLIFIQSSYPPPSALPTFPGVDKLLHLGGYGVLGLLLYRAFALSNPHGRRSRLIFYSILLTALYGVSDEIHQFFVVGRSADVLDGLSDAIGGAIGVFLYVFFRREGISVEINNGEFALPPDKKSR